MKSPEEILSKLKSEGNFRELPECEHYGKYIMSGGHRMLNLSSNDYLGLASDGSLNAEFVAGLSSEDFKLSSSSSRLLTGNFPVFGRVERKLASLFGSDAALTFSSGYHLNMGVLPAVTDSKSLILADKLVHASIIDGIRLSQAKCIRYRHNDLEQLEWLLETHHAEYEQIVIVTESIFSMDGDVVDLRKLVALKKQYDNVKLYVDEAHAIGVRGETGLGVAQEQDCIGDIDYLCGTFGKALASVGAYLICSEQVRQFLINRMRTLIFTTALPPFNMLWTEFVLGKLALFSQAREHLAQISNLLRKSLTENNASGFVADSSKSGSHIIPYIIGDSVRAVQAAKRLQEAGFCLLPVRPPTVPEGRARLRISLTAGITTEEVEALTAALRGLG